MRLILEIWHIFSLMTVQHEQRHIFLTKVQGWGLLSQFSPFRYFPKFSALSKHTLTVRYRVYIWQVSPQLSCGDTCQIWMWFEESNMYFCEIENFAYGEINERSFSNPHPWQGGHTHIPWEIYVFLIPSWSSPGRCQPQVVTDHIPAMSTWEAVFVECLSATSWYISLFIHIYHPVSNAAVL